MKTEVTATVPIVFYAEDLLEGLDCTLAGSTHLEESQFPF